MHAPNDTDVDAVVERVQREPARRHELIPLLDENAPLYQGRGTVASGWIRAWLMAKFAEVGLPPQALPIVVEVLENELEPRAVAAAALASRGMVAPSVEIVAALITALRNLRGRDEPVDLRSRDIASPTHPTTSASLEILAALRWQPAADVRTAEALEEIDREWANTWNPRVRRAFADTVAALRARPPATLELAPALLPTQHQHVDTAPFAGTANNLKSVIVEDQSGARLPLREYLSRSVTVVAFFYTRCQNPNKCSTTITKLAQLARELATTSPTTQIAAITYDPSYDLPGRLLRYGADRGLPFSETVRMFRTVVGQPELQSFFALHVGYNGAMVNRHGIELFLVDADMTVSRTWSRVRWQVDDVVKAVNRAH
jgi:cytochrome oxidase Cu insertion factor (SCO1/SenC/PrrC family)